MSQQCTAELIQTVSRHPSQPCLSGSRWQRSAKHTTKHTPESSPPTVHSHLSSISVPLLLPCADSQCGAGLPLTLPVTCKDISSTCPQALRDYQALTSWKSALQDPAGKLTSWQGIEPCSTTQPWAGVLCSEDGFAVVAVNVSGFGLIGPPPSVQSMAQLTVSGCQLQPQHPLP